MKGHFEVHAPYSRDLLRRRNMVLDDYTCAVCKSGSMETLNHLFLQCNFAAQCWATLNLVRNVESDPFNILETFKTRLHVPFFMEIIILMRWSIWMARNGLIFED
jgi:hypothetical protein